MADQEENTLKWGDIIRIHGVNVNKKEQPESNGLIVSKGYQCSHLALQTPTFTTKSIRTLKTSTSTGNHFSRLCPSLDSKSTMR